MDPKEKQKRLNRLLKRIAREGMLAELTETGQALEGLESVSDREVEVAASGLRKVAKKKRFNAQEMSALEAIVLPRERPVLNIVSDSFETPPAPWKHPPAA